MNYGTVVNCSASGSVSGDNRIGGLVGTNETSGQLISCKFTGSVTDYRYIIDAKTGLIIGQNFYRTEG